MEKSPNYFKKFFSVLLIFSSFNVGNAFAAGFVDIPTKWKLESYGEKLVVLWLTPSTCANGVIGLPAGSTITEHNRLYATILAAKLAKAKVFIYYDNSTPGSCTIVSYGLAEED